MVDQINLIDYYTNTLELVTLELIQIYGDNLKELSSKSKFRLRKNYNKIFSIKRTILGKVVIFLICLKETFPDEFPHIFIENFKEFENLRIPHIDYRGYVCTVDIETCSPNTDKPTELILELLNKAIQIFRNGFKDTNFITNEHKNEFIAYWALSISSLIDIENIRTFFSPGNTIKKLILICNNEEKLIFETEVAFLNFAKNLKMDIKNYFQQDILYIPYGNISISPFSSSIEELGDPLQKIKKNILSQIDSVYKVDNNLPIFISSIETENGLILFGWKPDFRSVTKIKGFREISFSQLVLKLLKRNKITKYNIERIDQDRIFNRIGYDSKPVASKKILLAGCGSVGSHLAMSLAKMGINSFTLIDSENLSIENISRHLCGYLHINNAKVNSVKTSLGFHFPYISFETYKDNILKLMLTKEEIFENNDLNIIIIGKIEIDLRFDSFTKKDTLYIWLEPFAIAAQAIFIPKGSKLRLTDFYTSDKKYKLSVIKNGNTFTKRESGCSTSFIPYTFVYMELFIMQITIYIIKILENNYTDVTSFTWISSLNGFESYNIIIDKLFQNKENELLIFTRKELEAILNERNN